MRALDDAMALVDRAVQPAASNEVGELEPWGTQSERIIRGGREEGQGGKVPYTEHDWCSQAFSVNSGVLQYPTRREPRRANGSSGLVSIPPIPMTAELYSTIDAFPNFFICIPVVSVLSSSS